MTKGDTTFHWGHDDLMALCAVRYCLGRMTYIVGYCADWLIEQWSHLSPSARALIQRDVEEEFERDDAARERGAQFNPLGWDCDRAEWGRVRMLWVGADMPRAAEIAAPPRSRSQKLVDAGFVRRPSLRALEMRSALELIATPRRPDGTWNRDREECQRLAAEAIGRYEDKSELREEAQQAALEKDAARYRWLKIRRGLELRSEPQPNTWTRKDGTKFSATHYLAEGGIQHAPADSLDATIDAAMLVARMCS